MTSFNSLFGRLAKTLCENCVTPESLILSFIRIFLHFGGAYIENGARELWCDAHIEGKTPCEFENRFLHFGIGELSGLRPRLNWMRVSHFAYAAAIRSIDSWTNMQCKSTVIDYTQLNVSFATRNHLFSILLSSLLWSLRFGVSVCAPPPFDVYIYIYGQNAMAVAATFN